MVQKLTVALILIAGGTFLLIIPAMGIQNPNYPAIQIQENDNIIIISECIANVDYTPLIKDNRPVPPILLEGDYYRLDSQSPCVHESRLSCNDNIALFEIHFEIPKMQVGTCTDDTHYTLDYGNQEIVTTKCWTFDCQYQDNLLSLLNIT